jgi:hypothetical protein
MEVGAKTVGNRSLNRKIMVPGQPVEIVQETAFPK